MKKLLLALAAPLALAVHAAGAAKPNIVYILADDLGWTDTASGRLLQSPAKRPLKAAR